MAVKNYRFANAKDVSALIVKADEGKAIKVTKDTFDSLKSDPRIPVMIEGEDGAMTVKACTAQTKTSVTYGDIVVTVKEA